MGLTGQVIAVEGNKVLVYMGTYDAKPWNRWFGVNELRPTIEQELEDLL